MAIVSRPRTCPIYPLILTEYVQALEAIYSSQYIYLPTHLYINICSICNPTNWCSHPYQPQWRPSHHPRYISLLTHPHTFIDSCYSPSSWGSHPYWPQWHPSLHPVNISLPMQPSIYIRLSETHHTTLNISTCQHTCIPTFLSITVWPTGADIHIGVSDNPYTHLDASVAAQLSTCTSLPGPLADNIDIEGQCQSGALGRFVYVYMQGSSGSNDLLISEVEVYGDPTETRM